MSVYRGLHTQKGHDTSCKAVSDRSCHAELYEGCHTLEKAGDRAEPCEPGLQARDGQAGRAEHAQKLCEGLARAEGAGWCAGASSGCGATTRRAATMPGTLAAGCTPTTAASSCSCPRMWSRSTGTGGPCSPPSSPATSPVRIPPASRLCRIHSICCSGSLQGMLPDSHIV